MIVLWLTGLSGAGKSTVADALVNSPLVQELNCVRLDGDDLREGLNSGLGFSSQDRAENLRRAAHVARILCNVGHNVICSFITPLSEDRKIVADILGESYVEVYISTSLAECEKRDPKGLYRRARKGMIPNFTGIGSPYEPPADPHVLIDSANISIEDAVARLAQVLKDRTASDKS